MYVGLGALTPQQATAVHASLPDCYTEQLDECFEEENIHAPECERFLPVNQAYDVDEDATDEIVEDLEYCDYSKKQVLIGGAVLAVGALALGMLIGVAVVR